MLPPMRLIVPLLIAGALNAAQAGIYQYLDSEGNVTFTSEPPPGMPAEPVRLPEINTVETPKPRTGEDEASDSTTASTYTLLAIAQPEDGAALRSNNGSLTVAVNVAPRLQPSDRIVLILDGQEVARGTGGAFALENVDRGTHHLSAAIRNHKGKTLMTSAPVSFTLLRISKLTRP